MRDQAKGELKEIVCLEGHYGQIWSTASIKSYLATGGEDGSIKLFDFKEYVINKSGREPGKVSELHYLPRDEIVSVTKFFDKRSIFVGTLKGIKDVL